MESLLVKSSCSLASTFRLSRKLLELIGANLQDRVRLKRHHINRSIVALTDSENDISRGSHAIRRRKLAAMVWQRLTVGVGERRVIWIIN